jgi:hypothetical protein
MDTDTERCEKVNAGFRWIVNVYAPAFLEIAKFDEQAWKLKELRQVYAENNDLIELRLREVKQEVSAILVEGGLPLDDPVWHKLMLLRGPIDVVAKAWDIADTAAGIALAAAANDAERKVIDTEIKNTMKRLKAELDELLETIADGQS